MEPVEFNSPDDFAFNIIAHAKILLNSVDFFIDKDDDLKDLLASNNIYTANFCRSKYNHPTESVFFSIFVSDKIRAPITLRYTSGNSYDKEKFSWFRVNSSSIKEDLCIGMGFRLSEEGTLAGYGNIFAFDAPRPCLDPHWVAEYEKHGLHLLYKDVLCLIFAELDPWTFMNLSVASKSLRDISMSRTFDKKFPASIRIRNKDGKIVVQLSIFDDYCPTYSFNFDIRQKPMSWEDEPLPDRRFSLNVKMIDSDSNNWTDEDISTEMKKCIVPEDLKINQHQGLDSEISFIDLMDFIFSKCQVDQADLDFLSTADLHAFFSAAHANKNRFKVIKIDSGSDDTSRPLDFEALSDCMICTKYLSLQGDATGWNCFVNTICKWSTETLVLGSKFGPDGTYKVHIEDLLRSAERFKNIFLLGWSAITAADIVSFIKLLITKPMPLCGLWIELTEPKMHVDSFQAKVQKIADDPHRAGCKKDCCSRHDCADPSSTSTISVQWGFDDNSDYMKLSMKIRRPTSMKCA